MAFVESSFLNLLVVLADKPLTCLNKDKEKKRKKEEIFI